ncbi:hypothetical protein [Flavobacterium solisilvae]|uniref:S1/P1 Nuclease n=1 Tax=Flavobacterium solisilvae TaxID=1852019 RepID=A0ABX1QRD5_9FLAO|nr:hypothetical protein [Flavobacterium solisilvae]NMH24842.1 hypothetical protein [Flavobacterium solisilvae]
MKTKKLSFKNSLLVVMLFMFSCATTFAQDAMFYVEQYWVKPSKQEDFVTARKAILAEFEKHKFPFSSSFSHLSDGSSLSISRIKNYADLDTNPYKEFSEKIGAAKFAKLSEDYNKCLSSETNFMLHYIADLSYTPKGETYEGYNFAEIRFIHVPPGDGKKIYDAIKSIKESFVKQGAVANFTIYKSGLGCPTEYYAIVLSQKNRESLSKMLNDNSKVIGDDVKTAIKKLYEMGSKIEYLYSWHKEDLSYKVKK